MDRQDCRIVVVLLALALFCGGFWLFSRALSQREAVSVAVAPKAAEARADSESVQPFAQPVQAGAKPKRQIRLQSRTIEVDESTRFPSVFCVSQRATARGTAPYLVVTKEVPTRSIRERLAALGARVVSFVPERALMVEIDAAALAGLASDPDLFAAVEYEPQDKLPAVLRERLAAVGKGQISVSVMTLAGGDAQTVRDYVAANGGSAVDGAGGGDQCVTVTLPADRVEGLLGEAGVRWVTEWARPRFTNSEITHPTTMNVDPVRGTTATRGLHLTGEGQRIMVCDSGLDTGDISSMISDLRNQQYAPPIFYPDGDETGHDPAGHGTHVSGTVCGTGANSSGLYRGVAYGAKMRMLRMGMDAMPGAIFFPDGVPYANTYTNAILQDRYRFHTDSWGSNQSMGHYDGMARGADEALWAHPELTIFQSAGNDGLNGDGTIGSPGVSKNVITIGSSRNRHSERVNADQKMAETPDYVNTISLFSSRGPTADGRIKPDLCAPGDTIISVRSSHCGKEAYPAGSRYCKLNGTSMATPSAAGAGLLLREWLVGRDPAHDPSAALMKAMLCGGATDMLLEKEQGLYPYHVDHAGEYPRAAAPNMDQGWGRVNLADTIAPLGNTGVFYRDYIPFEQGSNFVFRVTTTKTAPLAVQLAWVDAPPEPSAASMIVNDLDVVVTSSAGGVYRVWHGNGGELPDSLNNNESIRIPDAPAGEYVVSVVCPRIVYGHDEGGAAAVYMRGAFDPSAVAEELGPEFTEDVTIPVTFTAEPMYQDASDPIFNGTTNLLVRTLLSVVAPTNVIPSPTSDQIMYKVGAYLIETRPTGGGDDEWTFFQQSEGVLSDGSPAICRLLLAYGMEYRVTWQWTPRVLVTCTGDNVDVSFSDSGPFAHSVSGWMTLGSVMFLSADSDGKTNHTYAWGGFNASSIRISKRNNSLNFDDKVRFVVEGPMNVTVHEIVPDDPTVAPGGWLSSVGEPQSYVCAAESLPLYFDRTAIPPNCTTNLYAPSGVVQDGHGHNLRVDAVRVDSGDGHGGWTLGSSVQKMGWHNGYCFEGTFNGANDHRVVWLWTNAVNVSVRSLDGGTLSFSTSGVGGPAFVETNLGFTVGDRVQLRATPERICTWHGVPEGAVYSIDPIFNWQTVEFTVSNDVEITASQSECGVLTIESYGFPIYDWQLNSSDSTVVNFTLGKEFVPLGSSVEIRAPEMVTNISYNAEAKIFSSEYLRQQVTAYRVDGGEVVTNTVYVHEQGATPSETMLEWMTDAQVYLTLRAGGHGKVSIGGENWGSVMSDWIDLGLQYEQYDRRLGYLKAERSVQLYGGTNENATYTWEGLPSDATFNDAKKRIATLTLTDERAGLDVTVSSDEVFTFALDYQSSVEGGTISGTPAGVYQDNTAVTLTAEPASDYVFLGWTVNGVDAGTEPTLTLTLVEDTTVAAIFEYAPPSCELTTSVIGQGSISGAASSTFAPGTVVELTAIPASGHHLDHWVVDGVETGSGMLRIEITMDADKTVTAVFVEGEIPYQRYEQNDLVAVWDCQDTNHISSGGWKDTSGRYTFTWSDAAKVNYANAASDGISFVDAAGWGLLGNADAAATFGQLANGTMEVVIKDAPNSSQFILED